MTCAGYHKAKHERTLEPAGLPGRPLRGDGCWATLMVALPAASQGVCSASSPAGCPKCQAKKADDTHEELWFSNGHLCMHRLDPCFGACTTFFFFSLG